MTPENTYKRNYHPIVILMYHCNMLSFQELQKIPKRTRYNWNDFEHENYYGHDWAKDYIKNFDMIKDVYSSKYLLQATKFMCVISSGFRGLIREIEGNKKMLRKHANRITYFIEKIVTSGNLKKKDACRIFGVSKDWFYKHRKEVVCKVSKIEKCFKQYPSQLTFEDAKIIEKIVNEPNNKRRRKNSLYWMALRTGLVTCGKSTFSKYLDFFEYKKHKKKKSTERKKGFKATKVFEWLHVDVTHIHTINDGIQYVAYVKDNFSGALLHYKSSSVYPGSGFIRDALEEAFVKYNLLDGCDPINILSDGGPENKGLVLEWVNQLVAPPVVKKVTAQTPEFEYSNSMSESTHSTYNTNYLLNCAILIASFLSTFLHKIDP